MRKFINIARFTRQWQEMMRPVLIELTGGYVPMNRKEVVKRTLDEVESR